jgi:hypothetical protein
MLRIPSNVIGLLFVPILVGLGLYSTRIAAQVSDPPLISFQVTSALRAYPSDFSDDMFDNSSGTQRLGLLATMTNVSDSPVTISTWADAVVSIESITVEDRVLVPTRMGIDYDEAPDDTASTALVTLAPGISITFPINAVQTLALSAEHSEVLTYSPFGLGKYALAFVYSYTGPDNGFPNVYRGGLKAGVEFLVGK